jgi:hypothetical protein
MLSEPIEDEVSPVPAKAKRLADDQQVSRFLFSKNHFSLEKQRAKTPAFDPSPYQQLSVGHSSDRDEIAIWQMGDVVRQLVKKERLFARADLAVSHITDRALHADRDDVDFDGHTNVTGWPEIADDDERKRVWKGIAAHLADKSHLKKRPDGG